MFEIFCPEKLDHYRYLDQINDVNPFRSNSALGGEVHISFIISSKNGQVIGIGVGRRNKGDLYNGKVEKCVIDIVKKIKFPISKDRKNVFASYTFIFKHPETKE